MNISLKDITSPIPVPIDFEKASFAANFFAKIFGVIFLSINSLGCNIFF
jgi:hypothetical protein